MTTIADVLELLHLARRDPSPIRARVRETDPRGKERRHDIKLKSAEEAGRRFSPHGQQCVFDPNVIIPEVWLEPVGSATVAGRQGIRVRGKRRPTSHDYYVLPFSCPEYDIVVDAQRGFLLRVACLVNGREADVFEIEEIRFGEPA